MSANYEFQAGRISTVLSSVTPTIPVICQETEHGYFDNIAHVIGWALFGVTSCMHGEETAKLVLVLIRRHTFVIRLFRAKGIKQELDRSFSLRPDIEYVLNSIEDLTDWLQSRLTPSNGFLPDWVLARPTPTTRGIPEGVLKQIESRVLGSSDVCWNIHHRRKASPTAA